MEIVNIRLMSSILFMPVNVTEKPEKRKVLWLLHGARGDCRTPIQNRHFYDVMNKREIITVLPSALNSDYGNYPDFGTGYDFPSFFFNELMPFIYQTFPASCVPEDNIIAGASMAVTVRCRWVWNTRRNSVISQLTAHLSGTRLSLSRIRIGILETFANMRCHIPKNSLRNMVRRNSVSSARK